MGILAFLHLATPHLLLAGAAAAGLALALGVNFETATPAVEHMMNSMRATGDVDFHAPFGFTPISWYAMDAARYAAFQRILSRHGDAEHMRMKRNVIKAVSDAGLRGRTSLTIAPLTPAGSLSRRAMAGVTSSSVTPRRSTAARRAPVTSPSVRETSVAVSIARAATPGCELASNGSVLT